MQVEAEDSDYAHTSLSEDLVAVDPKAALADLVQGGLTIDLVRTSSAAEECAPQWRQRRRSRSSALLSRRRADGQVLARLSTRPSS